MNDCLGTMRMGCGSAGGSTQAPEKLLGGMDTHGVCLHLSAHQVVHFTNLWFIDCHLYLRQAVIKAHGCHELLVW